MDEALWTEEQCAKLNDYQRHGFMHPFTCGSGKRSNKAHVEAAKAGADPDLGLLVATPGGWVCPACSYRQDWAHDFMFEGRGADPLKALRAAPAGPSTGSSHRLDEPLLSKGGGESSSREPSPSTRGVVRR